MLARIFPSMFQHLQCDVYMCNEFSKWWIGLPSGPEGQNYMLCDSCAKALIANAPDELVPETVKANMWQEAPAAEAIVPKRKGGPGKKTAIVYDEDGV